MTRHQLAERVIDAARDVAEWLARDLAGTAHERYLVAALAAYDAAPEDDGWQPIEEQPLEPIQVEFFLGDAPESFAYESYRDERRHIGFWDGERFCDFGTGHDITDRFDPYFPTHWRPLPPPPNAAR